MGTWKCPETAFVQREEAGEERALQNPTENVQKKQKTITKMSLRLWQTLRNEIIGKGMNNCLANVQKKEKFNLKSLTELQKVLFSFSYLRKYKMLLNVFVEALSLPYSI